MNVMLRILSTGAPRASAVRVFKLLTKACPDWDIDFKYSKVTLLLCSQNEVFLEARKNRPDFLILMCDDLDLDDPEILRTLPEHDLPVVDCLVPNWQLGSFYWNCYQLTPNGIWYSDNPYGKTGVHQIYSSAMAMACFRRDVFDNDEMLPMYENVLKPDGTLEYFGGADTNLCKKLHKLNIPLYMDMNVVAEHTMPVKLKQSMELFRKWSLGIMRGEWTAVAGMASCICVNTRNLGVELPVCDSYRKLWEENKIIPIDPKRAYPPEDIRNITPVRLSNMGV